MSKVLIGHRRSMWLIKLHGIGRFDLVKLIPKLMKEASRTRRRGTRPRRR